ncbi:MAG: zeta toxin family protein [Streptosporangiaceae bacterium]
MKRQLARRADTNLPDGHPSSPRDENGTPRRPGISMADVETLTPPLTDAQWADHVTAVVDRIEKAGLAGLTTEVLHTTDSDHRIWSSERSRLHTQIIDEVYIKTADVPCERLAIMAGGLPGAGKSTVMENHTGIDRPRYLTINPDDFKEDLARRGALPDVKGLSPMEASALAHAESSFLARVLAVKALADGRNVIWDITMSSVKTASGRIDELRDAGYRQVDAIFVDLQPEVSVTRADSRHRHGHELFLGRVGLGGRCLIADIIRTQTNAEYGSVNRRVFETLKDRFDNWSVYDNSVDGQPPRLVDSSEK